MKTKLKFCNFLIKEFFGGLLCNRWPGYLIGHRKIGKQGWSSP